MYSSESTEPVVCACFVEMSFLLTRVPVQSHNSKGLAKSLCDFTGNFFVQCENPVLAVHAEHLDPGPDPGAPEGMGIKGLGVIVQVHENLCSVARNSRRQINMQVADVKGGGTVDQ